MNKLPKKLRDKISDLGEIKSVELFKNSGRDFSAIGEAEMVADSRNLTIGSMQRDAPIGLASSDNIGYISKWWNMRPDEHKQLDGVLLSTEMRGGDVYLVMFKK